MVRLGRHLIVECENCLNAEYLNDIKQIETIFVEAAQAANATVLQTYFHQFNPHGISGAVIIAESHLTIHTWPEYKYAAIDIFTCGEQTDPWAALSVILTKLKPEFIVTKCLSRGMYNNNMEVLSNEKEKVGIIKCCN